MTLFPETVGDMMNESILGRAQERDFIRIEAHQIRDYTPVSYTHLGTFYVRLSQNIPGKKKGQPESGCPLFLLTAFRGFSPPAVYFPSALPGSLGLRRPEPA